MNSAAAERRPAPRRVAPLAFVVPLLASPGLRAGRSLPPPERPALVVEEFPASRFAVHNVLVSDAVTRLREIRVRGEADLGFRPENFLGRTLTVRVEDPPAAARRFGGVLAGVESATDVGAEGRDVELRIVPWPAALALSAHAAVHADRTAPEVLRRAFDRIPEARYEFRLKRPPIAKPLICQYRETDLNFVSRVMEEEGYHAFWEDAPEGERWIVADAPPPSASATLRFQEAAPGRPGVQRWEERWERVSDGYALFDFSVDNATPVAAASPPSAAADDRAVVRDLLDTRLTPETAARYADARRSEVRSERRTVTGRGNDPAAGAGALVRLEGHPDDKQNGLYWITESIRQWTLLDRPEDPPEAEELSPLDRLPDVGLGKQWSFTAVPGETDFRPRRATPKPINQGVDVARVVAVDPTNPARVRILFLWDRPLLGGEGAPVWAPRLPDTAPLRVGDRAIVEFLAGDPDRPVVTGRAPDPERASDSPNAP